MGGASTHLQGKRVKEALAYKAGGVKILADAGIVRPVRPDKLARMLAALSRWGRGPAAGYISSAVDSPDAPAVIDELGTLTFEAVNRRTNALAHSLAAAGISEGDSVGIMCRNHRGFVEATVAVAKLGADALFLNTAFAGPQLTDVVGREQPAALIYDQEFTGLLQEAGQGRASFLAWCDSESERGSAVASLEEMIVAGSQETPKPPGRVGKTVILTSGTTGAPKGANRSSPQSLDPAMSLLSKIPLRHRQTSVIAAPLFHSWGFAHFTIGLLLGSTLVLRRRFEPEECLRDVERTRADSLVVIPVMMQRILQLPEEARARIDASSLQVVAASGSALPGDLATNWMDEYGDTLYNLYGSTEVAWATIATPDDMRSAPGTAGRTPRGTVVRLYDERNALVPTGETGRIFVGNELLFEGYTGGGSKDEIDELMATGDVGRMDAEGRLFVEGRDDEMIVSGGENVFPKEVEDLLSRHEAIADAAAIGVPDSDFGQRLRAFVVLRDGEQADEEELKAYIKANLARYKVPREIVFLEELPRNATGKVLKRELEQADIASG